MLSMLWCKTSRVSQDNRYDIIIDDGSHVPQHQIISLACLLRALNPGGLYIIEDLKTSYWCWSDLPLLMNSIKLLWCCGGVVVVNLTSIFFCATGQLSKRALLMHSVTSQAAITYGQSLVFIHWRISSVRRDIDARINGYPIFEVRGLCDCLHLVCPAD